MRVFSAKLVPLFFISKQFCFSLSIEILRIQVRKMYMSRAKKTFSFFTFATWYLIPYHDFVNYIRKISLVLFQVLQGIFLPNGRCQLLSWTSFNLSRSPYSSFFNLICTRVSLHNTSLAHFQVEP